MKFSIKPLVIAAGLALSVVAIPATFAQETPRSGLKALLGQLELTEEQRAALKDIMPLKLSAGRGRVNMMREFAPVVYSDTLDMQQLELLVDASISERKAHGLYAAESKHAFKQVLTDEQLAELEALKEQRKDRFAQRVEDADRPDRLEKLTSKLDLSDDQVEAMEGIFATMTTLRESMQAQRRAFKEFEQGLIDADEFDPNLWLAEFDLVAPQMRADGIALATNMNSFYTLLTDKQQAKLERMFKRKAKRKAKRKVKRTQD